MCLHVTAFVISFNLISNLDQILLGGGGGGGGGGGVGVGGRGGLQT